MEKANEEVKVQDEIEDIDLGEKKEAPESAAEEKEAAPVKEKEVDPVEEKIKPGLDLDELSRQRKESLAALKKIDDQIFGYANGLMAKRAKRLEKIEKITATTAPLIEEIGMLEKEINSIICDADIEELRHAGFKADRPEKMSFQVKDWKKFWDYVEKYESDDGFDAHDLVKRDIKAADMKKFYDTKAICPDGVQMKTFRKIRFTKVKT